MELTVHNNMMCPVSPAVCAQPLRYWAQDVHAHVTQGTRPERLWIAVMVASHYLTCKLLRALHKAESGAGDTNQTASQKCLSLWSGDLTCKV